MTTSGRPRLVWLDATEGDPRLARLWEFLDRSVAELSRGRFETELRHTALAAGGVRHPATRLLSDAALMASAVSIADDPEIGADALVLGCWGSPIRQIRSAVDIPVTSLPDASARTAASFTTRSAIVTVAPALRGPFAADWEDLGGSCLLDVDAVRAYDPESTYLDVVDAIDDPKRLIDRFDGVARAAVDDGADAVIVGCGYLAPLFTAHGYTHVSGHPDVPVYDCNALAFEHAAMLHTLAARGIRPAPRSYGGVPESRAAVFRTALDALAPRHPRKVAHS
ncbi:aspartate/glutamate racemase family protein [Agreia sp. PsM10]|uniref:aspartate/glutamate racemase family protein n=1 Tax=Agreia sp. PsM10 TaxID=3030533 RepID=UPI00263A4A0E|nr:aspartate/glutamate racemase family protein [Agreia sp. PsM10]MDN4641049.1 aspartate/glutamate racemase family protein [Agreia sp. PsM10]